MKNSDTDVIEKMENEAKNATDKEKEIRYYGLRKNKIRNKILNFFSLNKSKKFCAFYTITFPLNINDDLAYQLLNTWLTRCRKSEGLKSYLWVAERQKNNTLHFHLITNNYMKIGVVNDFMKECLRTQKNKGKLVCRNNIINKYNGVDVDNLYQSKRRNNKNERLDKVESMRKLSMYLTKYITKNETKSVRLPWHCSRDISALFISINYQDVSSLEIANLISDNPDAVVSYHEDFFSMHYFRFIPDDFYFADLININNSVYENFHPN
ncbi:hypothetical protein EG358_12585 [Chryseobacterium indoltheticum]|nr:hypothetical protein EG358_12585 [Chryseobacterium indoltheticum]